MYQFSGKLKTFSLALIIFGVVGIAFSFYSGSQKTIEDAKHAIEASNSDAHGGAHGEAAAPHGEAVNHDTHAEKTDKEAHASMIEAHSEVAAAHGNSHDNEHAEHVLHQLQNRPWSAFYVALFFSLGITLLVLAFYAIQRVAQVGWSVVILRVMEAITANLLPVSIIMALVVIASVMHLNHLFPWMAEGTVDPTSDNYDPIVDGKSWWMNSTGFLLRSIAYLLIWNAYRFFIRRSSIKEDTANDGNKTYKKNYNASVIFLFLFMITESMMSWDWIMGLDPHWFSTLFGWYVLAS
ncbi:MAG: quinol:cytochrome C oxidoreductase, partial [Polaribacter sp.]|nr:quinol:cytochrome C oxidoreductase [Polaribacter sp.]